METTGRVADVANTIAAAIARRDVAVLRELRREETLSSSCAGLNVVLEMRDGG
jgi:hypothetical protein